MKDVTIHENRRGIRTAMNKRKIELSTCKNIRTGENNSISSSDVSCIHKARVRANALNNLIILFLVSSFICLINFIIR